MEEKTIGEVARETGLRASALRYYEAEGLLPPARRRGGKRVYDADLLERLAVIELGKASGFTVVEVRTLLNSFTPGTSAGKRWRSLATGKIAELEARIAQAQSMKSVLEQLVACQCPSLADCGRALRAQRDPSAAAAPGRTRKRPAARNF